MLKKALFSLIIASGFTMTHANTEVEYHLSFPKPSTHYCKVEILITNFKSTYVTFRMPVWAPGSYKIRDFSQHVESFQAKNSDGEILKWDRLDKNGWKVNTETSQSVKIMYEVYCNEISVRQSYVDQYWAFVHGTSAFMLAEGFENLPITLRISPYFDWDETHVAATSTGKNRYSFLNYDELADAPIALGNFDVIPFEAAGVPHKVVMLGPGNYSRESIEEDFKKICEEATEIFGEHPSKEYIHFIQNVESGGGGLEHANSQTSAVQRWSYSDPVKYKSFLALVSHEYFHLWNVKRIRPKELGPFNYNKENYTELLWVAEGVTSYFDDLILLRSGYHTEQEYLDVALANINRLQNTSGRKKMTLAESSFNAWIKAYLPNENSGNVSVSYYNKGAVVSMLLDLEMLKASNGKKRLDDLMRYLYQEYYKKKNRGFTPAEFNEAVKEVCGKDLSAWLQEMVYTTSELDYNSHFKHVGLQLEDQNTEVQKPWFGTKSKADGGRMMIEEVVLDGPASQAGISAGDEILSIQGFRAGANLADDLMRYKPGQRVEVLYSRKGQVYSTKVELGREPSVKFAFKPVEEATEQQKKLYRIWLGLPEETR